MQVGAWDTREPNGTIGIHAGQWGPMGQEGWDNREPYGTVGNYLALRAGLLRVLSGALS